VSAFEELGAAYRDRSIPDGRKAIGLMGATIPVELVLASGAVPLAIAAAPDGPTPTADRYLEDHFDGEVRATLQALLEGAFRGLDLLVLARSSDAYLELYYVLKEIVRLGGGEAIPPLHLYDLLHGRSDANRAYGLARLRELASRLEATTGVSVTSERLRAATRQTNLQRASVNRLLEARRDPASGISGVEAMTAIGAGRFLDLARHAALVDTYLAEPRPTLEHRPRVLLAAGVALSNLDLHEALESGSALVVGEDDAWGSRAGGELVDESAADIFEAVFDKHFYDLPSPRLSPAAARDEWLRAELGRSRPDALAVYIPRSDTWFGWDFPRLRSLAAEAGVPTLLLRDHDPAVVRAFFAEAAHR